MSRNKNLNLTYELLSMKYFKDKKSIRQIAGELYCDKKTIQYYMKKHCLKPRSRKDAIRVLKYKYIGKENLEVLYLDQRLSMEKIAKIYHVSITKIWRCMKEYNMLRRTLSQAHIGIQAGSNHPLYGRRMSKSTKKKIRKARMRQHFPISRTSPELNFLKICEKYSLPFKYVGDGSYWIFGVNPDFVHSDGQKVAIEIFGRYWHNPENIPVRYPQTYSGRTHIFLKHNWNLIIFWEDEVKDEIVLKKLKEENLWDGQTLANQNGMMTNTI